MGTSRRRLGSSNWPVFSTAMLIGIAAADCRALDDSVLWLPASYRMELAPELRQAALKLEATERCQRVMRGSLHDSTQGLENAVFLLVCRDAERHNFSVLADANTLEMTYMSKQQVTRAAEVVDPEVIDAQIEQLRGRCEALFTRKTRFMKNLHRVDNAEQQTADAKGTYKLLIPFDADSLQGATLKYQAECSAADLDAEPVLAIKPRRSAD